MGEIRNNASPLVSRVAKAHLNERSDGVGLLELNFSHVQYILSTFVGSLATLDQKVESLEKGRCNIVRIHQAKMLVFSDSVLKHTR